MSCAYAMIIDIASLWSSFENAAGLMLSRHAVSVSIRTSMRILTMCLQTAILLRSIQRQDSKDAEVRTLESHITLQLKVTSSPLRTDYHLIPWKQFLNYIRSARILLVQASLIIDCVCVAVAEKPNYSGVLAKTKAPAAFRWL
ncbi:unnamed protein product [Albugo candida]|uniref:Uncharacterized protein n=1 Tax=Albugo candida TaxID=65357 RepID=A0A024G8G5_9STRA|nr:unnamed protein product [Albugo candida]|eukprot:CCI43166.1 unnamed protein product [Albugo candida]